MLNHRIQCIANMVEKGMIVADIGTDHAQLPIYLVQNKICLKSYACDVTEGPLESAKKNIKKFGLESQITTVLSDGLKKVPCDANCIIIAGMGYYTIQNIMLDDLYRFKSMKQVIIQSNTDLFLLRKWLFENGFMIRNEVLIEDRSHYYVAMDIAISDAVFYEDIDFLCGPILRKECSDLFIEYAQHHICKLTKLLSFAKDQSAVKQFSFEKMLWEQAIEQKKHSD